MFSLLINSLLINRLTRQTVKRTYEPVSFDGRECRLGIVDKIYHHVSYV